MKKSVFIFLLSVIFVGCASYSAYGLTHLEPEPIFSSSGEQSLCIACKAYNRFDCEQFLGRNLIEKGYQPIQITLRNTSGKTYVFDPANLSIPLANVGEIAKKVHTNTVGRVAGYTLGGFLLSPLLWIPAVVDGIKSKEANEMLDYDYHRKIAKTQDLRPGDFYSAVVFVHCLDFINNITLTLTEKGTANIETLPLIVR